MSVWLGIAIGVIILALTWSSVVFTLVIPRTLQGLGRRARGSGLQLSELAEEYKVSLSAVCEAVTRLGSGDFYEGTPQRGCRVRS